MVVVLADMRDEITVKVLESLKVLGVGFFHIHEEDKIFIDRIDVSNPKLCISVNREVGLNLAECVVWNRHSFILKQGILNSVGDDGITSHQYSFLFNEVSVLGEHVIRCLKQYKLFGWQVSSKLNKLQVIHQAQKIGFNVPQTFVVGNAYSIDSNLQYVTKSISEIHQISDNQSISTNFTYSINPKELGETEQFFPSLLQQMVSKIGDVRLFVFRDLFYACLIVSDNGEIDYRQNYNLASTRFLPYEIDKATQAKVYSLFEKLDLDSGSVDFMLDSDGELWFLEVNPEGQFGFMEYHCGYDIAKHIALKISEYAA